MLNYQVLVRTKKLFCMYRDLPLNETHNVLFIFRRLYITVIFMRSTIDLKQLGKRRLLSLLS